MVVVVVCQLRPSSWHAAAGPPSLLFLAGRLQRGGVLGLCGKQTLC